MQFDLFVDGELAEAIPDLGAPVAKPCGFGAFPNDQPEHQFARHLLAEKIGTLDLPALAIPALESVEIPGGVYAVRMGRKRVNLEFNTAVRQPLVVSYGMGTDSTALLILMAAQGIRPDVIMFADVGSEKPETYDYIPIMNAFLEQVNFPLITVVNSGATSKHASLGDNCHANRTMPSLAYGLKGCSQKWKVSKMDVWSRNHREDYAKAWYVGLKVRKLIGYDGSPADCKRSKIADDREYTYSYPLRDAGIQRPDLIRIIDAIGLEQPGKSACYFCPATKGHEIVELGQRHPALLADALRMEAVAEARTQADRTPGSDWWISTIETKSLAANTLGETFDSSAWEQQAGAYSTVGLGRSFAWRDYLERADADLLASLDAQFDTGFEVAQQARAERQRRGIRVSYPKSGHAAGFRAP